jgi:hypothetical protein
MKKTISTILVCVLLVGSLLTLASCEVLGMLIGTYSDGTTTYAFSGKEVTITTTTSIGSWTNTITKTGEYKIDKNEKDQKTIAITISDDDGNSTTTVYRLNTGKDDQGAYIEIISDGLFGDVTSRYYSVK